MARADKGGRADAAAKSKRKKKKADFSFTLLSYFAFLFRLFDYYYSVQSEFLMKVLVGVVDLRPTRSSTDTVRWQYRKSSLVGAIIVDQMISSNPL